MQLDVLWEYMQSDLEADKFETAMRQAPNRQKLLKHRTFLMEQQEKMKKIEDDIGVMTDRMEAVKDDAERLQKSLAEVAADVEQNPPTTDEDTREKSEVVAKLLESLQRYETELAKMRKDTETRDRQQKEIRVRAAKAKAEYDQIKEVYDTEFKGDSAKLKKLRAKVEKEAKQVEPDLLEEYKKIKQHCTPPVALLVNNQCSGCFMSLPISTLRDIKTSDKYITCDNCGRILYVKE